MCAGSDEVAFECDGGGRKEARVIGVFLRPCRNGNLAALGQQQGAIFGVERPVALAGHAPSFVHGPVAHSAHHFVKFTGQPFLFTQAG